jgi:3-oxoacyl-[acyl-carrier protein] reductase
MNGLFDLSGRVIVITGGSKGLGKTYSRYFAGIGARVVVADVDADSTRNLVDELVSAGHEAMAAPVDISQEQEVEAMAAAAVERWGRIDGLVNNAALMSVLPRAAWTDIPIEEWGRVMEVNLRGMFLCCRAVYPAMKRRQAGKIVNISSGRILDGVPFRLHYTTSKAGVVGLTRSLAREVGADNIAVNALLPGFTLSETQLASSDAGYLTTHDEQRAIKRPQVPDDLIGAVHFLLADASNFMTGQSINVDGGWRMH